MELPEKIAFVDIETTGTSSQRDRIIELGIIRVEAGQVVRKWQSLVDPQQHLPPEITLITGISAGELEKARTFRGVADEVDELLSGCVFAAHNARFDYSFIKNEFKRLGKKINLRQLCTVRLSRQLYPEHKRHNLDEIISRFNLQVNNRHRALDDAQAIYEFYTRARSDTEKTSFNEAVANILRHPTAASLISPDQLERLPESPGVYIFYGQDGMPLYVGKSINIAERVRSHLANSLNDAKEMRLAQTAARLETVICSGELGALMKESQLIKEMQPLYNRMLRNSSRMVTLKAKITNGYKSIQIEHNEIPDTETVMVFKTERQARDWVRQKCKEQGLCEKLMGLEKMRRRCFASELGRCRACCGREDKLAYNLRFDLAMGPDKFKNWPFRGPIVIKEESEDWVFDNWCLIGQFRGQDLAQTNPLFDLDTYHILRRYLKQNANWKKVHVVNKNLFQDPAG